MTNLWEQVKQLFNRAEQSTPAHPAVHELIERDEASLADYEQWKNTLEPQRLLNWLLDQYAVYRVDGRLDSAMDFLDTPSSKGFVIHFYDTNYRKREITHFFDFLKEKIRAMGYRAQMSDRRVFSRPSWVETQERHYLKPVNKFVEGEPIEQKFGNVTIELELRDDQVRNLRLRATSYSDSLYQEADSFQELMAGMS